MKRKLNFSMVNVLRVNLLMVKMLTNIYIEKIMKKIPNFVGVFSADNAPFLKKGKSSMIVNFDKRGEPGSHFIAIFKKRKNKVYYFDPLKLNIFPIEIARILGRYPHTFDFSENIQSFESTYCGFYCMLFILSQYINEEYWKKICKKFEYRNKLNDEQCIKLICKSIKIISKMIK